MAAPDLYLAQKIGGGWARRFRVHKSNIIIIFIRNDLNRSSRSTSLMRCPGALHAIECSRRALAAKPQVAIAIRGRS